MRVAVIGCGSIGSRHARNLKALGHEPFVFDCDTAKMLALASEVGCHAGSNIPNVDAAMICTPASNHSTEAGVLLSMNYTGPLFVEKPLALSVEECEVFEAWPHPTTMVGYNLRWTDAAIDRKYGNIDHDDEDAGLFDNQSILTMLSNARLWPGSAGSGEMVYECSHEIDIALWLGAGPCMCAARITDHSARIWFVDSRLKDFCHCVVNLDWRALIEQREWQFSGDDIVTLTKDDVEMSYQRELSHFVESAKAGVATLCPFADGIRVLDVIEQAKAMART